MHLFQLCFLLLFFLDEAHLVAKNEKLRSWLSNHVHRFLKLTLHGGQE